jgi:hypothetical protein
VSVSPGFALALSADLVTVISAVSLISGSPLIGSSPVLPVVILMPPSLLGVGDVTVALMSRLPVDPA